MTWFLLMKSHSKRERFKIFGLLGRQVRKRHEDEKSTSLGSNMETWKHMEIRSTSQTKNQFLSLNSRKYLARRRWNMDHDQQMNSEIDGTYTRVLRHALNIYWRHHVTNENLYGDLPKISSVIQQRLLRLAGHCNRSDETVANLILWKPNTDPPHARYRPALLTKNSAQPCQIESCGEIMWIRVRPTDDDDDIMSYYITVYFIVLYYIILYIIFYYITIYYILLYCIILYYLILCYIILCYIILYYITLLHSAIDLHAVSSHICFWFGDKQCTKSWNESCSIWARQVACPRHAFGPLVCIRTERPLECKKRGKPQCFFKVACAEATQ